MKSFLKFDVNKKNIFCGDSNLSILKFFTQSLEYQYKQV